MYKALIGDLPKTGTAEVVAAYNLANALLFDIVTRHISNATLLQTLSQSYDDKGFEAINYIKSAWLAGSDENKLEANYVKYREATAIVMPEDTSAAHTRPR